MNITKNHAKLKIKKLSDCRIDKLKLQEQKWKAHLQLK